MVEYDTCSGGCSEVWRLVSERVAPAEREEVRRAIGQRLIERNEGLAAEVEALSSIVEEFRQQNDQYAVERTRQAKQKHWVLTAGGTERKLLEEQIRIMLQECGGAGLPEG